MITTIDHHSRLHTKWRLFDFASDTSLFFGSLGSRRGSCDGSFFQSFGCKYQAP